MAVSEFATLRAQIARQLQDPDHDYWTADELDDYINEGQKQFAEQTRCLRGETVISTKENIETYNFPADYLQLLRMEDDNGASLVLSDWRNLQERYGTKYRDATGDPTTIYSDLDGHGQFRFYPRPSSSIEQSAATVSPEFVWWKNLDDPTTILSVIHASNLIYFCSYNLVASWNIDSGVYTVISTAATADVFDYHVDGNTVYFVNGTSSIYKLLDEVLSVEAVSAGHTFTTIAGGNGYLWLGDAVFPRLVRYLISDSSETVITLDGGAEYITTMSYSSESGLLAVTSGIVVYTGDKDDTDLSSLYTAPAAIHDLYVNVDGDIFHVSVGASFGVYKNNVLLINDYSGTRRKFYFENDNLYLTSWSLTASLGPVILLDLTNGTSSEPFSSSLYDSSFSGQFGYVYHEGRIFTVALFLTAFASGRGGMFQNSDYQLIEWTSDLGELVYADDDGDGTAETFTQDNGGITDVGDSVNIAVLIGDNGVIRNIYPDADAFRIFYIRRPAADRLEIENIEALKWYALWMAYMRDGDNQNLAKADSFFRLYEREQNKDAERVARAFLRGTPARPVPYYF